MSVEVNLGNKTYVPVFYRGDKISVRARCVWIKSQVQKHD